MNSPFVSLSVPLQLPPMAIKSDGLMGLVSRPLWMMLCEIVSLVVNAQFSNPEHPIASLKVQHDPPHYP